MKVSSFIFAFYVLFLAIYPGVEDIMEFSSIEEQSCCKHSCTSNENEEEQSSKKDDSEKKSCNPFQSCKCCVVIKQEITPVLETLFIVFANLKASVKEKDLPNVTIDFWQPPKIA